jgi:Tfp pilus assembly protein PilV
MEIEEKKDERGKDAKKAFAGRRRSFSLVEVIIAMFILATAVFAGLETIGYALSLTSEVHARMKSYAQLEEVGLYDAMKGHLSNETPSTEAGVDRTPKIMGAGLTVYKKDATVPHNIEGVRLVYRHTQQSGKLNSPVFIVFVKIKEPEA